MMKTGTLATFLINGSIRGWQTARKRNLDV